MFNFLKFQKVDESDKGASDKGTSFRKKPLQVQIEKEQKKRRIVKWWIAIMVFLYLGVNLFYGDMGLIKYFQLKRTLRQLDVELVKIEKDRNLLMSQVAALKGDSFYIEKHAREEYQLAKSGEMIYKFEDNDK